MNRNGDGWKHNTAVGVTERDADDTKGEPLTYLSDDDEADKAESPDGQSRRRAARRRKRIAGASLFLLVLIAAGAGLWVLFGGGSRTRVNVPVRDNSQRTDQSARGGDDATTQAIAEVRSATASPSPTPAASASTAIGTTGATGETRTIIMPTTPVTVPIDGASSPPTEAGQGQQGGASRSQAGAAARPMGSVSERNPERSIRCAPTPIPVSARQPRRFREGKAA